MPQKRGLMASKLDQSARVCAIVVTYHPHAAFLENVKNLAAEVASVIVADNTEGVETPECLRAVQNARGVEILRNGENRGIAVALNLGIKQAIGLGFQWVATFDQDSAITSNYFESMFAAYESCPFRDHVPLIAPELCYSEPESQQKRGSDAHFLFSETTTAMTSGSLIRTDILATAGFYDETFFMDYVDYEFCLRLEKHG